MSHLTEQDRCKIQNLLNAGDLPREIAFKIGKNPSTIQREIRNIENPRAIEKARVASRLLRPKDLRNVVSLKS